MTSPTEEATWCSLAIREWRTSPPTLDEWTIAIQLFHATQRRAHGLMPDVANYYDSPEWVAFRAAQSRQHHYPI